MSKKPSLVLISTLLIACSMAAGLSYGKVGMATDRLGRVSLDLKRNAMRAWISKGSKDAYSQYYSSYHPLLVGDF